MPSVRKVNEVKRDSCVPLVASGKAERRRKPKGKIIIKVWKKNN